VAGTEAYAADLLLDDFPHLVNCHARVAELGVGEDEERLGVTVGQDYLVVESRLKLKLRKLLDEEFIKGIYQIYNDFLELLKYFMIFL